MMILRWIACGIFIILSACESKIDKMIPQSWTIGAVQSVNLTIKERETIHAVGGRLLNVNGVVPFDIKREQLKPTLLAALKTVKQKYPSHEEIYIDLHPDIDVPMLVGTVKYISGVITLRYFIPSEEQMQEVNKDVGKMRFGGIFGNDPTAKPYKVDYPLTKRPNVTEFENGKRVWRLYKETYRHFTFDQACKKISDDIGLPINETEDAVWLMSVYYSRPSGEETLHYK